MDLAVRNLKEEAAAVLRAHGALHSLLFAAERGMPDEVAARIVAGQDVNARDQVILLCVCVWAGGWVWLLVYCIRHVCCALINSYTHIIYIHTYIHICTCFMAR